MAHEQSHQDTYRERCHHYGDDQQDLGSQPQVIVLSRSLIS